VKSGRHRLSHVDDQGAARMVDVSGKSASKRRATAAGTVHTTPEVVGLIANGDLPKGDALATARVAGILAAKRTSELIPLCHQIALSSVDVDFEIGSSAIEISAAARTTDRTGVEMEALTAVTVAAVALYDMIKAVDPEARIDNVRVVHKEGGKAGVWTHPQ
jgi:cyclic pyranopterin phosphate synthase